MRDFWKGLISLWRLLVEPKPDPSITNIGDDYLYLEGGREMRIWAFNHQLDKHGNPCDLSATIYVHSIRRWRAPHDRERISETEQERILQSFCRLLEAKDIPYIIERNAGEYDPDEDIFYRRDWVAEAEKIRLAFGIKKQCEFVASDDGGVARVLCPAFARLSNGQQLYVNYSLSRLSFQLYEKHQSVTPIASVEINWAGKVIDHGRGEGAANALAQGLYLLGLLAPEVEAALGMSISEHEKLEWAREYEERYGL